MYIHNDCLNMNMMNEAHNTFCAQENITGKQSRRSERAIGQERHMHTLFGPFLLLFQKHVIKGEICVKYVFIQRQTALQ